MTELPYPFVSDDGRTLSAEAVQGNFDALSQGASDVARVFGVNKRSGSITLSVTWPGGTRKSNFGALVTHSYGTQARVIAQLQTEANTGAGSVALFHSSNDFGWYVETASVVPPAATSALVTFIFWEP